MNTDTRSLLVALLVTTMVAILDLWAAGGAVLLGFLTAGPLLLRDGHGRPFEADDRAAAELLATPSLDQALDRLVASVLRHSGGHLDDDLAVVLAQPRRVVLRRAA